MTTPLVETNPRRGRRTEDLPNVPTTSENSSLLALCICVGINPHRGGFIKNKGGPWAPLPGNYYGSDTV